MDTIRAVMAALVLLVAPRAFAFSPAVHRALSERAVALEAEARPALRAQLDRVGRGAAWEDLNLARKWTRWNHYYSPRFDIPTLWRRPSNERVASLVDAMRQSLLHGSVDRAFRELGHAVHHVQDMASPLHVVPIQHGLGDGFESSDMVGLVAQVRGDGVPELNPTEAQQMLAEETDVLVDAGALHCGGREVPYAALWHARDGRFGTHGDEKFGHLPGCDAAEDAFVRDRLDRALAYTRAVVRWAADSAGE